MKKKTIRKKSGSKNSAKSSVQKPAYSVFKDERIKFISGLMITGFAVYLLFAFIAYLFWWKSDQSFDTSQVISGAEIEVKNWSGKSGAWFADIFIRQGFGLAAFFIPVIFCGGRSEDVKPYKDKGRNNKSQHGSWHPYNFNCPGIYIR